MSKLQQHFCILRHRQNSWGGQGRLISQLAKRNTAGKGKKMGRNQLYNIAFAAKINKKLLKRDRRHAYDPRCSHPPGAGLTETRGMTLPVLLFLTSVAGTMSPLGSITCTHTPLSTHYLPHTLDIIYTLFRTDSIKQCFNLND